MIASIDNQRSLGYIQSEGSVDSPTTRICKVLNYRRREGDFDLLRTTSGDQKENTLTHDSCRVSKIYHATFTMCILFTNIMYIKSGSIVFKQGCDKRRKLRLSIELTGLFHIAKNHRLFKSTVEHASQSPYNIVFLHEPIPGPD